MTVLAYQAMLISTAGGPSPPSIEPLLTESRILNTWLEVARQRVV